MDISLKCTCGKFRAVASDVNPKTCLRATCMCADCQAYAHYLGRAKEILDVNGGTDIFPVTPAQLKITQGHENLKALRLSNKGMYRWYAGCCKTPLANSMVAPKTPFAGVFTFIVDLPKDPITLEQALGPIRARMFGKYGIAPLPADASQKAPLGFILGAIKNLIIGTIKKAHQPSPFFTNAGLPVVAPYVLSASERDDLMSKVYRRK